MKHKVDRRKLGLPSDQRRALLNNLVRQLVRHGYVRTTLNRAKDVRRVTEKLISLTKEDSLHARREARKVLVGHCASSPRPENLLAGKTEREKIEKLRSMSLINGEDLVKYLFDEIAPRYSKRPGGYTRLTKAGTRRGDGATAAVLELVD
jgi:large subunit ribosomal protein L17